MIELKRRTPEERESYFVKKIVELKAQLKLAREHLEVIQNDQYSKAHNNHPSYNGYVHMIATLGLGEEWDYHKLWEGIDLKRNKISTWINASKKKP